MSKSSGYLMFEGVRNGTLAKLDYKAILVCRYKPF